MERGLVGCFGGGGRYGNVMTSRIYIPPAIQGELEVFYDLAFKEEAERALLSSCGCSGAVFQRE